MDEIARRAIELAAELAEASAKTQTATERAESAQLARMMQDRSGKAFTLAMVDQVFRSPVAREQADRLRGFLHRLGTPKYLPAFQRFLLETGASVSRLFPTLVMAQMQAQLRRSSARVILAGEPRPLHRYLAMRRSAGTRVNLNHLGEAVLGEQEAGHRRQAVLDHLADPAVDYISVKISAIFSQINIVDWDHTLSVVKDRLRLVFRSAMAKNKFVNLDMEEYRDLAMTLSAFQQLLDEDEFKTLTAGIVLQAYIPDSWRAQQRLTAWAMQRVQSGGAPIKLRLVKGANLAMELVEAELHGWNPAPYTSKADTDANYRRMMEFGCQPQHAKAVHIGVASHNLFDVALALVLRKQLGVQPLVELEMLEGMANYQARAVQEKAGGLLVYAPAVKRADFLSAMAYLVRRLDENTAPENFLHDMFDLSPTAPAWERQKQRFVAGWENRLSAPAQSHRASCGTARGENSDTSQFYNAADSDWTQSCNRTALLKSIECWQEPQWPELPAVNDLLTTACAAQKTWADLGHPRRATILRSCAEVMERARYDTIAQMVYEGKKSPGEADGEVSEAVDYARYVASTAEPLPAVRSTPLGVVVVTPPWNFPLAIPCSGVLAALVAGNAVILKPAPETVGVAYRLVQQLWAGGIPRDVLQFFPCPDGPTGQSLITGPRVAAVVLTGAYETARAFLNWRPGLKLFAETSGKNAMVITHQADRDLAIKDLVNSAFGHSGQKCSAASLGILQAKVYDDPAFRRSLRDAAGSLKVGPATDLGSTITPLIRPPGPALLRALTTLDPGEDWLLEPDVDSDDPCLWSPGIKLGVAPGSWFHHTECFGPVLGLMRAESLARAIEYQNDTPYGLTGGIHSLDDSEIEYWRQNVQVGNAYINRALTGAIVQRQPFGGWKRSSLGPGAKAGGPNYPAQFARLEDSANSPVDYQHWWETYFSLEHDPSNLRSESNHLRYRPCQGVVLRLQHEDPVILDRAKTAARICGVPLHLSIGTIESEAQLAARLPSLTAEFLRTVHPPGDALLTAAYEAGLNWIDAPMLACGRHELPHWLREQSVSQTRHRYGLIAET